MKSKKFKDFTDKELLDFVAFCENNMANYKEAENQALAKLERRKK